MKRVVGCVVLCMIIFSGSIVAQDKPTKDKRIWFGGVYLGINRTALLKQPIRKDTLKSYNVSVLSTVNFRPKKRILSLQVQLIKPVVGSPLLRMGVSTRVL